MLLLTSTSLLSVCHTTQTLIILICRHRGIAYQRRFIISVCLICFTNPNASIMVIWGRYFPLTEYLVYCLRYQSVSSLRYINLQAHGKLMLDRYSKTPQSFLTASYSCDSIQLNILLPKKKFTPFKILFSFIFRNRDSPNTLLESDATKNSQNKTKNINSSDHPCLAEYRNNLLSKGTSAKKPKHWHPVQIKEDLG